MLVPPPDACGEAGRGLRDAAEKTRSRFGGASRVLRMGVPHGSRGQCGVSPRASGSRGRFWPPRPSPWRHSRGLHRNPHRACLINASPPPHPPESAGAPAVTFGLPGRPTALPCSVGAKERGNQCRWGRRGFGRPLVSNIGGIVSQKRYVQTLTPGTCECDPVCK